MTLISNHEKGSQRDKKILAAIEAHKVMDTDQVTALFFGDIKNGKRVAQKRLKRLHDTGQLKRCRVSVDQPYYYYAGRKPGQIDHTLGLNWIYVWRISNLQSWEALEHFEHEPDYKQIRPDALTVIRNKVTGESRLQFVEMDMAGSGNEFDKVHKYNQFYESGAYEQCWWVDIATRFPPVLVVTTGVSRGTAVQKLIDRENVNDLEFRVQLLDQIKRGCG
jgi:hypothetical protein